MDCPPGHYCTVLTENTLKYLFKTVIWKDLLNKERERDLNGSLVLLDRYLKVPSTIIQFQLSLFQVSQLCINLIPTQWAFKVTIWMDSLKRAIKKDFF